MNKKLKIGLFSFAGLAVAGVVGGVTAGVLLNQQNSTVNKNNNFVSNTQNTQSSAYSLQSAFDKTTQQFTVTIKNGKNGLGVLKLVDASKLNNKSNKITTEQFKNALTDTLIANAGDKIYVAVVAEEGYELRDLKVWGSNPNITLETTREDVAQPLSNNKFSGGVYSFVLPSNTTTNEEENQGQDFKFPIDEEGTIHVDGTFVKTSVQAWKWSYKYKSYVINLDKDITLDNNNSDLNINKVVENGEVETSKLDTIPFIIFLNGHNVNVKTFTIPSGATLMFIKNTENTNTGDVSKIQLSNDKEMNYGFVVNGVIGNYSGVEIIAPIHSASDIENLYNIHTGKNK